MNRKKFNLSHSIFALLLLLVIQSLAIHFLLPFLGEWLVVIFGILGAGITVYVATEAIEEVRNTPRLFMMLFAIVAEFIVFFACEYWHLLLLYPQSFPALSNDPFSLLLHSTMVFVFNPIYFPASTVGQALLFINITGALVLVLFILQNVTQIRQIKPVVTRTRKTKTKKISS